METQFWAYWRISGNVIATANSIRNSPLSTKFRIHAARLRRRIVMARNMVNTPDANPAVSRYGVKKFSVLWRRTSCPSDTHAALRKLMNATARRYQTAKAAALRDAPVDRWSPSP